jgi:hypothetical protein
MLPSSPALNMETVCFSETPKPNHPYRNTEIKYDEPFYVQK